MDVVGHRRIFYAISGTLVVASVVALAVFGLKLGIDFTGGSLLELEFSGEGPDVLVVGKALADLNLGEVRIQPTGERGLLIRLRQIDEPTHQLILQSLAGRTLQPPTSNLQPPILEKRFDAIGPAIGQELRRKSLLSLSLVVLLILAYIAWAFRKVSSPAQILPGKIWAGKPVRSWSYGLITVAALIHDVTIPSGLFALLGRALGYEADTLFVTALLTILGFSVHDTIVVFDRIRENLKKPQSADFAGVVNASVNQTLARSINTSLTVLLAVLAIYFLGAESTRLFALVMGLGIIVGTYSSIFIASPLLVTWHHFQK